MAGSLNRAQIIGNLGNDPDVRTMQSGDKVVNLSIATSETWKDKNTGEKQERTEWHRVTIFNQNLVSVAERYLSKGSKVYIDGQLQTRKWQDQQGQDRYTTEIVLKPYNGTLVLLSGGNGNSSGQANGQTSYSGGEPHGGGYGDDTEIPF